MESTWHGMHAADLGVLAEWVDVWKDSPEPAK